MTLVHCRISVVKFTVIDWTIVELNLILEKVLIHWVSPIQWNSGSKEHIETNVTLFMAKKVQRRPGICVSPSSCEFLLPVFSESAASDSFGCLTPSDDDSSFDEHEPICFFSSISLVFERSSLSIIIRLFTKRSFSSMSFSSFSIKLSAKQQVNHYCSHHHCCLHQYCYSCNLHCFRIFSESESLQMNSSNWLKIQYSKNIQIFVYCFQKIKEFSHFKELKQHQFHRKRLLVNLHNDLHMTFTGFLVSMT